MVEINKEVLKMKCCICGKSFKGAGNNPDPIRKDGSRCCDECNMAYVIPARIKQFSEKTTPYEKQKAKVYATGNKWAIENFHLTHD